MRNQAQASILSGVASFVGGAVFLRLVQMDYTINAFIVAAATMVIIVQQSLLFRRYEREVEYWRNRNGKIENDTFDRG